VGTKYKHLVVMVLPSLEERINEYLGGLTFHFYMYHYHLLFSAFEVTKTTKEISMQIS